MAGGNPTPHRADRDAVLSADGLPVWTGRAGHPVGRGRAAGEFEDQQRQKVIPRTSKMPMPPAGS